MSYSKQYFMEQLESDPYDYFKKNRNDYYYENNDDTIKEIYVDVKFFGSDKIYTYIAPKKR